MKKFKQLTSLLAICILAVLSLCFTASAATKFTETLDGIEYTYEVRNDKSSVSITKIDYYGFSEIHIPETLGGYKVVELGLNCMAYVTYDEANNKEIPVTVYIPKTVTEINPAAFYGNYAEKYIADPDNPNYCNDEYGVLYSKDKTVLYRLPQFANIKSYTVPSGVETIGGYAFNACEYLEEVNLPNTLESVGTQAFTYAYGIKKLELPDSVTYLSENAFIYCSYLEELKLSAGLTKIAGSAFSECYNLKKVIIPEGVTKLERYAFENDQSLEEVYLPSTLTTIEKGAFGNCLSLKDICYAGSEETLASISIDTNEYADGRPVVIDKVNFHCDIPVATYEDIDIECQNDVLLVSGTGAIPTMANGSWSYAKDKYANTATGIIISGDISTVGSYFFDGFTQLSQVIVSSESVTVEPNAFNNCAALRNVVLFGNGTINENAFANGNSDINVFVPQNGTHSINQSAQQLKIINYLYDGNTLSFNGSTRLNAYEFLDNMTAFCLIYDNITSVRFSSLTFEDLQLYYLDEDFDLVEIEGNQIENCEIYPALTEAPDDAITFNELINSISDGSVDRFYLITTSENQADIVTPEIQIIQEIADIILRALRWVVTLMDRLFAILNRFFR